MLVRYLSVSILISVFLYACTKDQVGPSVPPGNTTTTSYDTVYPLNYLPAYPGSYWNYLDDDSNSSSILTSNDYVKDAYTYTDIQTDTFYIPLFDGAKLWRYEVHGGGYSTYGTYNYPFTRLLSDSMGVGSSWYINIWSGTSISRKIKAKDTTIIINGQSYFPTIVVEDYFSNGPPFYLWTWRRYYTKDIGMIKEEHNVSTNTIPVVETRVLDSYFINH